jgi:soluble lytic murein transglycosylase-like protein
MQAASLLPRILAFFLVFSLLVVFPTSIVFPGREAPRPVFDDYPLPRSLSLCGEPMPLEDRRVWEMLDREFNIAVWDRAQVFLWLKRAGRYFPHIEEKLAQAGLPDDLKYLAVAESALLTEVRSSRGALGPWQFMTPAARRNGLRKDRMMDERRSFEQSTEAAIKYLKRLKRKFGTWALALAAYNCGEARLKKRLKKQKEEDSKDYYRLELPAETERFIFRIASAKIIMENPKRYGYNLRPESIYKPIPRDSVPVRIRVPLHLTDVARQLGTDYKALKELNPEITGHYLPVGRYELKVPSGLGPKVATVVNQLTRTASYRMEKLSKAHYVVQPGDTLSHIAKRTGVSVSTLKRLNGISGSLIMTGQKLRLSP